MVGAGALAVVLTAGVTVALVVARALAVTVVSVCLLDQAVWAAANARIGTMIGHGESCVIAAAFPHMPTYWFTARITLCADWTECCRPPDIREHVATNVGVGGMWFVCGVSVYTLQWGD